MTAISDFHACLFKHNTNDVFNTWVDGAGSGTRCGNEREGFVSPPQRQPTLHSYGIPGIKIVNPPYSAIGLEKFSNLKRTFVWSLRNMLAIKKLLRLPSGRACLLVHITTLVENKTASYVRNCFHKAQCTVYSMLKKRLVRFTIFTKLLYGCAIFFF